MKLKRIYRLRYGKLNLLENTVQNSYEDEPPDKGCAICAKENDRTEIALLRTGIVVMPRVRVCRITGIDKITHTHTSIVHGMLVSF